MLINWYYMFNLTRNIDNNENNDWTGMLISCWGSVLKRKYRNCENCEWLLILLYKFNCPSLWAFGRIRTAPWSFFSNTINKRFLWLIFNAFIFPKCHINWVITSVSWKWWMNGLPNEGSKKSGISTIFGQFSRKLQRLESFNRN